MPREAIRSYRNYIFDFYGTICDIRTDEASDEFWEKTAAFFP
jgi:FMN phosphatase YigB (HAD superfamily)